LQDNLPFIGFLPFFYFLISLSKEPTGTCLLAAGEISSKSPVYITRNNFHLTIELHLIASWEVNSPLSPFFLHSNCVSSEVPHGQIKSSGVFFSYLDG
jgi:hypothetical protein